MATTASPSIDNLEILWRCLVNLCEQLTDEEWTRPTGCPGWSVQDNISHLIDYESRALGRPAPQGAGLPRPHTRNELGEMNELGVDARRDHKPADIIEELRDVAAARSAQLRALSAEDLQRPVATPAGPGTLADMLTLRVMDTWSHEQDIRRAVGRPGHERGPAVDEAIAYWARALPMIVAKRAGAPDGTVAVFEIGDTHRTTVEVTAGRGMARGAGAGTGDVTVRLTTPATTFAALVGGRSDAPDDVTVTGDTDLGRRIVGALGFMP